MHDRCRWIVSIGALGLAACGGRDGRAGFSVRDSAGITIAESTEPQWAEGGAWHLATKPELQIGVIEGDSAYQLFRVWSAKWLSDGRIVAVNAGTNAIRVFGPDGRFEREFGREGEAPGEFRGLNNVEVWPGDTVLAIDRRLPRLTLFDPAGNVLAVLPVHQPGGEALPRVMRLADGQLLAPVEWTITDVDLTVTDRIQRLALPVLEWERDGTLLDTLAVFDGTEVAVRQEGRGTRIGTPIFGHSLAVATHADEVFAGTGESFQIRVLAGDGSVRRIIRVRGEQPAITDADMAAVREHVAATAASEAARASAVQFLSNFAVAERRPAYTSLRVDDEGNLWTNLEVYGLEPSAWNVFGPDGRWLGEFTFPERFRVYDIRGGRVLGRWQDDADVEYLRVYRIEKG